MKKVMLVSLSVLILLYGCSRRDQIALRIGPVNFSAVEFEEAFRESQYVNMGKLGREMFLEQFIDTKLVLLEAESRGLDKDPGFLKDIQRFWEQALLKRIVARENDHFAGKVKVSEDEIQEYYQQHRQDFNGRELGEIHDQVKWVLIKIKQSQLLSQWMNSLRTKTDIKINKELLGIKE
ncbi:MAG: hypothetical protein AB1650_05545 [Candidatus Omnitrophota bacterium]